MMGCMGKKYDHPELNQKIPDRDEERIRFAVRFTKIATVMNEASEKGEWPTNAPEKFKRLSIDYAEPMAHVWMVQAERLTHKYDEEEYTYMGDLLEDWELRIALQFKKEISQA